MYLYIYIYIYTPCINPTANQTLCVINQLELHVILMDLMFLRQIIMFLWFPLVSFGGPHLVASMINEFSGPGCFGTSDPKGNRHFICGEIMIFFGKKV